VNRELDWDGLPNARSLGGLPVIAPDASTTVHGRVHRSASLSHLTDAGWTALGAAGVRTVIDLRNRGEGANYVAPGGVVVHHAPIEDQTDRGFMAQFGMHLSTPRYYPEVLARWPHLVVRAFRCIAAAQPGGVVVHCVDGQDRTGQIVAMLLSLVGVPVDAIADDYERAMRANNAFGLVSPLAEYPGVDDATMGVMVGEARAMLTFWLSKLDVADYLLSAGMTAREIGRLRSRLVMP
jgi:protein-tyrosine phosphatase